MIKDGFLSGLIILSIFDFTLFDKVATSSAQTALNYLLMKINFAN